MGFPALTTHRALGSPRGLIAAVDVGSSKICCLIARHEGGQQLEVLGIGNHKSSGLKAGVIVDQNAAAQAILTAIASAEEMAGEVIERVYVNAAFAPIYSDIRHSSLALNGRAITAGDLQRLYMDAKGGALPNGYSLLQAFALGFTLDQSRGITDPRGMSGQRLGLDLHLVAVPGGALQTLLRTIAACHLEVAQMACTPYASAMSCLVADEMELGTTLIDLGGGLTKIAVFAEGQFVLADALPIGGRHITNDIARGLTTPLIEAERIKTLYGHTLPPTVADEREMILIPQLGEAAAPEFVNQAPRSSLIRIIRPRLEEIFELVSARLAAYPAAAGQNIVLVGGGALIPGCRELAQKILQRHVRMGQPRELSGLAGLNNRSDFATAIGLLQLAVEGEAQLFPTASYHGGYGDGLVGRVMNWFRQNI